MPKRISLEEERFILVRDFRGFTLLIPLPMKKDDPSWREVHGFVKFLIQCQYGLGNREEEE